MQAIMCKFKMERLLFDISQAYLFAKKKMPKDQSIPVSQGLRKSNNKGEELFSILRRALYGHPLSADLWEQERNAKFKELFTNKQWNIHQSERDLSLFIIDKLITNSQIQSGANKANMIKHAPKPHSNNKNLNDSMNRRLRHVLQRQRNDERNLYLRHN